MHDLQSLLKGIHAEKIIGNANLQIDQICFDSRKVAENSLFIACKGTVVDGHQYISQAIAAGSTAIVCENLPEVITPKISYVVVANSAYALGIMAANFYNNPSKKLELVAITGTNGKTTTVYLLHELVTRLGYQVGLLSTIYNKIENKILTSTHTTGDALQINHLLNQMVQKGCTHCFMEASSHAIAQNRIAGLHFKGAAFMNISHDHLNYHQTFDNYIYAKKKLFDHLSPTAFALFNRDDKRGTVMAQNTKANQYTFSIRETANFTAKVASSTIQGLELSINNQSVWFQLIGDFNAYNLLAAYAIASLLGMNPYQALITLSSIPPPHGRMNCMRSKSFFYAIIDYAHTPDALKKALQAIKVMNQQRGRVITVVGCGGNRDQEKRPLMGKIAFQWSDQVIFTSDNPRYENPMAIIKSMQVGLSKNQQDTVLAIEDREMAIKMAFSMAQLHDIILIAGKGHETYKEVAGVKTPFYEHSIVMALLSRD